MSAKELKENAYYESLQESLLNVEMTLNHLYKLDENTQLPEHIIKKDKIRTILNLELSLALYCIVLRKMKENNIIFFDDYIRKDINSIIHSNRFDYDQNQIVVYSQKGRENIDLKELLEFGHAILKSVDI